jgi:hypothetical protein
MGHTTRTVTSAATASLSRVMTPYAPRVAHGFEHDLTGQAQ